jgi:L-lactate dehydrogenase complex protein LldE
MKVSLFLTCLGDQLYPQVGMSVVRVLRRHGCDVDFPPGQMCCGQPAWNSGYADEARKVARRLVQTFAGADCIVSPSGSCSGMIKHYYEALFENDPGLRREAEAFAGRVYEFSQFMVRVLKVDRIEGSFPHKVTYHPSCHGARLLGIREEPVALLHAIRDLELVPLPKADDCCGFGGTFAVKLAPISVAIVDEKVAHVKETQAHYLAGTDLGCLMNIAGRMQVLGVPVEAMHIAELVDRALQNGLGHAA